MCTTHTHTHTTHTHTHTHTHTQCIHIATHPTLNHTCDSAHNIHTVHTCISLSIHIHPRYQTLLTNLKLHIYTYQFKTAPIVSSLRQHDITNLYIGLSIHICDEGTGLLCTQIDTHIHCTKINDTVNKICAHLTQKRNLLY